GAPYGPSPPSSPPPTSSPPPPPPPPPPPSAPPLLPSPSPPIPSSPLPPSPRSFPDPLPLSSHLRSLRAFFRSPANGAFLPSAALDSLAADLLPPPAPSAHASNNLVVLPWRSHRRGLIVFFPAGENADLIGFLGLSFEGPTPEVRVDEDGDVFKQREGFKHPHHRILKMSVVSASSSNSWFPIADSASPGNPLVEGFLVATTLYSVNWFRVETRVLDSGRETPFLVPLAKQGFDSSVVDACWSPHFEEESAALLESGDLCWFNLDSKCGGKIRVSLGGGADPGEWLSCNFGGQPWIVIVACSKAVALVDLRRTEGYEHKVLARIEMPGLFDVAPSVEKKGSFLAFCKANFNDFHFSVVTEHQLLLFDTRQPLVPVLTWDHGLENPSYIAMFRLSELRPSDEFKWASDSGFAILVGSFWNGEFNLFCYGPKEKGTLTDTTLYAWELPSSFPLTDQRGEVRPFLVVQPSRRGEKSSSKASPGEGLVGPVIPIPFLLTLQERNIEEKSSFVPREEPGDDLLDLQCKKILKHVYPEISIADIGNCNGWSASEEQQNDKTFFVYEPNRACSADHGHDLFGSKVSDLSPVKLDFDTPSVTFKPGMLIFGSTSISISLVISEGRQMGSTKVYIFCFHCSLCSISPM
ncbi:hypothetical protein ACMD2_10295, partial [Ananas comosus]